MLLGSEQIGECRCLVFQIDLHGMLDGAAESGGGTVAKIDQFKDVGVAEGCSFHEQVVIEGELFVRMNQQFMGVDEFIGDEVFVGVGGDLEPIFGEWVGTAVGDVAHHFL